MREAIDRLAHFIAGTSWDAIPETVREHAKLVFLDTVGVMLAGTTSGCAPAAIRSIRHSTREDMAEHKPPPDSIAHVDVATYRFAANMREPDPINGFAARYSLPHAAAALILRGNAGYHAFTDEAVCDPAIAAIRRKVTVREDPALKASVPRLKPARITVTLTDGPRITRRRYSPEKQSHNGAPVDE